MKPGFLHLYGALTPSADSSQRIFVITGIWAVFLLFLAYALEDLWYVPAAILGGMIALSLLYCYFLERATLHVHYLFWVLYLPLLGSISAGAIGIIVQEANASVREPMLSILAAGGLLAFLHGFAPEWPQLASKRRLGFLHPYRAHANQIESKPVAQAPSGNSSSNRAYLVLGAAFGLMAVIRVTFETAWVIFGTFLLAPLVVLGTTWLSGHYARALWEISLLERDVRHKLNIEGIDAIRTWRATTRLGRLFNPGLRRSG